jgi:serine O-acetyltransferase
MIRSKADYIKFKETDMLINGQSSRTFQSVLKDIMFPEPTIVFLKYLRKYEYYYNAKSWSGKIVGLYYYAKYCKWSLKTGISIPRHVFNEGLCIPHYGSIVVNPTAKVGRNCMIHVGVNIGTNGGSAVSPIIGNNVYIGPGAKIFGEITIADNCYIGANAVVNSSFIEPFSVIVGAPAKAVKTETKVWWQKNRKKMKL